MEQTVINAFLALATDPKVQAEVLHAIETAAQTALEIAAHARREGGLFSLPQQLQADEVKKKYAAEFSSIGAAAKAGQITDDERAESIRTAVLRYMDELKGLPA